MAYIIKVIKALKAAIATSIIIILPLVTLGKELDIKNDEVVLINPLINILSIYPLLSSLLYDVDYTRAFPLLNNNEDDKDNKDEDRDNKKGAYIS
jgi:hypothetical protein